jgi:integrase
MNLQRLIEQYISYQRSLGSLFISDAALLRAFGRARGPRARVGSVRIGHVDAFLGKARPVTRTWFTKLSCLRCFFRHAMSRGHITTAPLPTVIPKRPPVFAPYIYTRKELRRLLQVVESHPQSISLEPATIRTMILVYYGTGLRLREATNLTCADVDLKRSLLTIRNTKFGKSRLVPVGPQLTQLLVQYDHTRPKGRPAEAPFFTKRGGCPVHLVYLERKFRLLCDCAGIRRTDTHEQPRIHDLRHNADSRFMPTRSAG